MTKKMRNTSDGEWTYRMAGRVPLIDLANWHEGGDRRGVVWVTAEHGVKAYSRSRLIQPNLVTRTCLMDGSDMFDDLEFDNLA
jgi:hypothetical protein